MTRRTAERHAHRIEVRFWRQGKSQSHSGFTIDLSKTGMFLGTTLSLEPGERLLLELVDREHGFKIEGQVARVHRVAMALRHVEQPGVGIRFLGPGELVGALLQGGKGGGQRSRRPLERVEPAPPAPAPAAAPPAPASPEPARETAPPSSETLEDLFGPDPDAPEKVTEQASDGGEEAAARHAPAPAAAAARSVSVEFANRDEFLSVWNRDIQAGGLFITTESPAALHDVVLIDLRPPIRADKKFSFEARVVHRFDPESGGGGAQTGLTGMGVQFLDPDRVRAELKPIVAELGG